MYQLKRQVYKKAFTLAEILITLGVIGVVAALTIPILIQDANERTTVTALKKTFSTLSQAYNLAVQDNGTPDTWGLSGSPKLILGNLTPYLKVEKDCTSGNSGCFPAGVNYAYLSNLGGDGIYDNQASYPKLRLADGTLIAAFANDPTCVWSIGTSLPLKNTCGQIWVDINGYKGPNQWGIDTFNFFITKYGIIPDGSPQQTISWPFSTDCKNKATQSGFGCAAWVIYNENMDYLNCNTLNWGGQTSCN